jgi:predicted lipid-binding transport protein (Tim44 family)
VEEGKVRVGREVGEGGELVGAVVMGELDGPVSFVADGAFQSLLLMLKILTLLLGVTGVGVLRGATRV